MSLSPTSSLSSSLLWRRLTALFLQLLVLLQRVAVAAVDIQAVEAAVVVVEHVDVAPVVADVALLVVVNPLEHLRAPAEGNPLRREAVVISTAVEDEEETRPLLAATTPLLCTTYRPLLICLVVPLLLLPLRLSLPHLC